MSNNKNTSILGFLFSLLKLVGSRREWRMYRLQPDVSRCD